MNFKIYDLLKQAQLNENAMLDVIEKFNPLLKKWANSLSYEDAYEDILYEFVKRVKSLDLSTLKSKTDPSIVIYLQKTVKNLSLNILRKKSDNKETVLPIKKISSLSDSCADTYTEEWDKLCKTEDEYPEIIHDLLANLLSERECAVMEYIIFYGYRIKTIANIFGVTPEAISISKAKAIKKLKNYYQNLLY